MGHLSSRFSEMEVQEFGSRRELHVVIPSDKIARRRRHITERTLRTGMRQRYGLDWDTDLDSDTLDDLFYNADLRSHCGFVMGWGDDLVELVIWPKYWATGEKVLAPGVNERRVLRDYYGDCFRRMLADSVDVQ